jgi:hypothetical protein
VALSVEDVGWYFHPYHRRGHFQFGRFTPQKYFALGLIEWLRKQAQEEQTVVGKAVEEILEEIQSSN